VDIDGQKMKQSDIVAKLEGFLQLHAQKEAAKATARSAVQALTKADPEITRFAVACGEAVRQVLGKNSPLLANFGLTIPSRKTPSTETQVLANAKRAATRLARKTMGSVQRKAVKGVPVLSVTVSTDAEPSVVSAGSQPEPATGPG
jgi:hypothetical protein